MLNEFLSVSNKMFKASFIVMSYDSVLQSIGLLSTAIFLWVGATQVIHGHLSVGGFVAFSSLTAMAYSGILRTLGVWDSMQFASVLLNRLNDIFEQEPEQGHDRSRLAPVHSLEGRIELRGASFGLSGSDHHPGRSDAVEPCRRHREPFRYRFPSRPHPGGIAHHDVRDPYGRALGRERGALCRFARPVFPGADGVGASDSGTAQCIEIAQTRSAGFVLRYRARARAGELGAEECLRLDSWRSTGGNATGLAGFPGGTHQFPQAAFYQPTGSVAHTISARGMGLGDGLCTHHRGDHRDRLDFSPDADQRGRLYDRSDHGLFSVEEVVWGGHSGSPPLT